MSSRKRVRRKEDRSPSPPKRPVLPPATARVTGAQFDALFADQQLYASLVPRDIHTMLAQFVFRFPRGFVRDPGALKHYRRVHLPMMHDLTQFYRWDSVYMCRDDDALTVLSVVPADEQHTVAGGNTYRGRISLDGELDEAGVVCQDRWQPFVRAPSGRLFGLRWTSPTHAHIVVAENDRVGVVHAGDFDSLEPPYITLVAPRDQCVNVDETLVYLLCADRLYIFSLLDATSRQSAHATYDMRYQAMVALSCRKLVLFWRRLISVPVSQGLCILTEAGEHLDTVQLPPTPELHGLLCADGDDDHIYLSAQGAVVVYSLKSRAIVATLAIDGHTNGMLDGMVLPDGRLAVSDRLAWKLNLFKCA